MGGLFINTLACSLAYFPLCFVVVRRSLGHALNVRSLLRVFHASPTEKYAALNVAAEEKNTPHRHPRRQAGKNRRERFFASEASPKGAYQG